MRKFATKQKKYKILVKYEDDEQKQGKKSGREKKKKWRIELKALFRERS